MENVVVISIEEYERLKALEHKKLSFNYTKIKCPYCKNEHQYNIEAGIGHEHKFILCDVEEGGCDRQFILRTNVKATFNHQEIAIP